MARSQSRENRQLNEEKVLDDIKRALRSHEMQQDSAFDATAYCYAAWTDTLSQYASKEAKAWIKEQFDRVNEAIDAHNAGVELNKTQATEYTEGKLDKSDLIFSDPRDDIEKKAIEDRIAQLTLWNTWDRKDWAAAKLVRIEARDGASPFTEIVKFVFGFNKPNQSTSINRYTLAMEWIHARFKDRGFNDISEITDVMKQADSFESLIEDQREVNQDAMPNRDKIKEDRHLLLEAERAIRDAPAKATIDLDARHVQKNKVVMIGRYIVGKIEIVGEVGVGEAEMDRMIRSFDDPDLLPADSNCELLARLIELGNIVEDGRPTNETYDGTESGEKIESARTLSYRVGEHGDPELVISARNADVSPVIYAQPRDTEGMGTPNETLVMQSKNLKRLDKAIKKHERRRILNIAHVHNPLRADGKPAESPFAWRVGNKALMGEDSDQAVQQLFWQKASGKSGRALDQDNFKPVAWATLDGAAIWNLYEQRIKPWGLKPSAIGTNDNLSQGDGTFEQSSDTVTPIKKKTEKKSDRIMTLVFKDQQLIMRVRGLDDFVVETEACDGDPCIMPFRPKEFHDIFKSLCETFHIRQIHLAADEKGLIEFKFSDKLAHYTIYLPTVTTDGKLQSRRVGPMSLTSTAVAAE